MSILFKILLIFVKIGIFGYGGGPSMLPLVEEDVVQNLGWLTMEEFTDAIALGNSLPGPIIIKTAAFVGLKMAGIPGAIMGVVGVMMPSLIAMLVLASFFLKFKDLPKIQSILKAVRPAIVGLLAIVAYDMFSKSVRSWDTALIAVATFGILLFSNIHPIFAIIAAAIIGYIFY